MKQFLDEIVAGIAAGFAHRLAENVQTHLTDSSANQAAQHLGIEIAQALTASLGGNPEQAASNQPLSGVGPAHHYTDREIIEQRLSVWNYAFPPSPALHQAMRHYQAHLQPPRHIQ